MAKQQSKTRSSGGRRQRSQSRNGRSASQKPEDYQFARNLAGGETVPEAEYRNYVEETRSRDLGEPDVLLDVPLIKVDSIHLNVENLDALISVDAKVLELLDIDVGVEAHLGKVKIEVKGVEAQLMLKARLDHVAVIVDRVMTSLDRNPKLIESIGKAVEQLSEGAGQTLEGAGEAVEDVGEGAGQAVDDVGEGAGQAVDQVGEGAGKAAGELGEGAGEAAGQAGEGAGQAVGNLDQTVGSVGQAAGQAAGGVGEAAGGVGEAAGQAAGGVGEAAGGVGEAAGGVGEAAGQAAGGVGEAVGGAGQAAGGAGQAAEELGEAIGDGGEVTAPKLAKAAAKSVAKELGSAASDEAKELGMAAALKATRKAKELGERRRQRKAERHNATEAALRKADELDVDLDEIEGTGADGRITIGDVRDAAKED